MMTTSAEVLLLVMAGLVRLAMYIIDTNEERECE